MPPFYIIFCILKIFVINCKLQFNLCSGWKDPIVSTNSEEDLNLNTEDLLPFNPMLQRVQVKIKQRGTFPSDKSFRFTIYASLYREGTYVAQGRINYNLIRSGIIKKAYLVISRASGGWCSDNDVLKPEVVKSVTWSFGTPPFAFVDGKEAKIVKCFYGTTRDNWMNTIKTSGITHIRVVVNTVSQYIETQYRILPGKAGQFSILRAWNDNAYLLLLFKIHFHWVEG